MFTNVLVGVGEDEHSRDAIALATRLVEPDGELTLAHVYGGDTRLWRGSSAAYESAQRESAQALLETVCREAAVGAHRRWRQADSVGRGLHELAEIIRSDLLVVGSSRRSRLGRVFLGDDTRHALNGAPCPVAVAPAGYARGSHLIREIGVGYDGSPESEHALSVARTLAAENGSRLSAFEAVSVPPVAFAEPVPDREWLQSLVEAAYGRVSALEDVEPHAVYGHAAEELALFSASVDLLVVGARGYGPVGRLVHGSTSQRLARTARCPVLVLTRSGRAHERPEAPAAVGPSSVGASP